MHNRSLQRWRAADLVRNLEVEEHLRSCGLSGSVSREPACAQASGTLGVFSSARRPAGERSRRILRIGSRPATRFSPPRLAFLDHRRFGSGRRICLGIFVAQGLVHPRVTRLLLAELTDSHIRSLIGTHLTDVISSDQHAVRPWFEGNLVPAPPVADLSSQGFPCWRAGRKPSAAARWRRWFTSRRKHFINLSWPADAGSQEVKGEKPQRGYNVIRWRAAGMNYWAVSELAEDDLQARSRSLGCDHFTALRLARRLFRLPESVHA